MTDPTEILDAIIAAWRDIPALAREMGGIGGASVPNIDPYHDAYGVENSIQHALRNMKSPQILAFYAGQEPSGDNERYGHRFTAWIRMKKVGTTDVGMGYTSLLRLMIDGVPASNPEQLQFRLMTIHPECDPINPPSWQRLTDVDGLDYFEINLVLVERMGL